MSDAKTKDALYKVKSDYFGLPKAVLDAYLHAARRFTAQDNGLALKRVEEELNKLAETARIAREKKSADRAALLADESWKEQDTFGLNTRAFFTPGGVLNYAGGNLRYVNEGGYREYHEALIKQKKKDGNVGSALKGAVQFTLNEEKTYISGGKGWWKDSDDAITYIKETYDLPCWGALASKAEITGEHEHFHSVISEDDEVDFVAEAIDDPLLDEIDAAIEFHKTKTKLQRNIQQWKEIRSAIENDYASDKLKAKVKRAASSARPGGKYYDLWMEVQDRINSL